MCDFVPVPPSKGSTVAVQHGICVFLAGVVTRLRPPTPHNFIAFMDCGRLYPSAINLHLNERRTWRTTLQEQCAYVFTPCLAGI